MHARSLRPICKLARFDNPGQNAICSETSAQRFRKMCSMLLARARPFAKQLSLVEPSLRACLIASPQMTLAQKVTQAIEISIFRSIVNEAQDLASYLKHMVPVVLRASGWEQKGSSVGVCVGAQYKACLRKHSFNFMWLAMRFCDRGLVGL